MKVVLYTGLFLILSVSTIVTKTQPRRLFKHVVHIGIDGLKPDCIANATGGASNIRKLGEGGSWTHTKARTVIQTVSGPSWTAALCSLGPRMSGVRNNQWKVPWIKSNNFTPQIPPITGVNQPFPCIFEILKKQDSDFQTAYFFNWDWLQNLGNKGIPGGYIDYEVDVGHFGKTPEDFKTVDEYVAGNATKYIKDTLKPKLKSYSFIHLVYVDEIGHLFGWCSQEYENAVGVIDNLVGDIIGAIETIPELKDDTLIIVHSDHGAIFNDTRHAFKESIEGLLIPVYLKGTGIKKGYEIQADIVIEDMAPTIMFGLGFNPHKVWTGAPIKEVFDTEEINACSDCGHPVCEGIVVLFINAFILLKNYINSN
ncbi:unnamed protein product [Owenia fusiformis]|uniref:Uncharacterized protein n=1 Tax=Owenia fusiformis TaxID=6347 RepID=A0A8J1TX04_OWEFU|nr:unnamed protein product [Owenia fusiformis]